MDRLTWVDNAKAVGIIAIVLGHGPGLSAELHRFLYTFHVPLFFFLAGFLLRPVHLETSYGRYLQRNVVRLIVPYVFFWLMSFLLWLGFQTVGGNRAWSDPGLVLVQLKGLLLGTGAALDAVNGVLWFYTALFVTTALFYWMAKPQKRWVLPWSLVATAAMSALVPRLLQQQRLPWNVDLALTGVMFYGMGYLARREGWFNLLSSLRAAAWVALAGLGVTTAVMYLNEDVDMAWQFFGHSYGLYVLGSFAGILMVSAMARLLPVSGVARYLSENTLVIFSIHFPLFFAFWGIGVYLLGLPRDFDQHTSYAVLYAIAAMIVCVPLVSMIRRFFPWGLGARGVQTAKAA